MLKTLLSAPLLLQSQPITILLSREQTKPPAGQPKDPVSPVGFIHASSDTCVRRYGSKARDLKWHGAMEHGKKKAFAAPINNFHLLQLFGEIAGFKTNYRGLDGCISINLRRKWEDGRSGPFHENLNQKKKKKKKRSWESGLFQG